MFLKSVKQWIVCLALIFSIGSYAKTHKNESIMHVLSHSTGVDGGGDIYRCGSWFWGYNFHLVDTYGHSQFWPQKLVKTVPGAESDLERAILEALKRSNFQEYESIKNILSQLNFIPVKKLEELDDDGIQESEIPDSCVKLQVAIQDLETGEVRIHKSRFNKLSAFDQVFLKIHEAYRKFYYNQELSSSQEESRATRESTDNLADDNMLLELVMAGYEFKQDGSWARARMAYYVCHLLNIEGEDCELDAVLNLPVTSIPGWSPSDNERNPLASNGAMPWDYYKTDAYYLIGAFNYGICVMDYAQEERDARFYYQMKGEEAVFDSGEINGRLEDEIASFMFKTRPQSAWSRLFFGEKEDQYFTQRVGHLADYVNSLFLFYGDKNCDYIRQ